MRTYLVTLAVFTVVLLLMGAVTAANIALVSQNGRAFSVESLQIMRGSIVRFSNDDKFIHQTYVASPSMSYESDEQPPGTSVEVSFPVAGKFEVRCHIHPKMLLKVEAR